MHGADKASVPLETAWGRHHVNVLASLKLGHLDVPLPSVLVILDQIHNEYEDTKNERHYHVHLDDDVVAELGAGDVHVLVSVIATDDGRGRAAGGGHSEGVIDTVPWGQNVTDIR